MPLLAVSFSSPPLAACASSHLPLERKRRKKETKERGKIQRWEKSREKPYSVMGEIFSLAFL